VKGHVLRILGEVLGHEAEEDVPFYELGLSSRMLVRVRARLEQLLDRRIPDSVLFEHPTAAALAAYLAGTFPAPAGGTTVTDESAPAGGPARRRIAIVGMAARFPGAGTLEKFWDLVRAGRCAVSSFGPADQEADRQPTGGVLDDTDCFDSDFFGMTQQEAELTDPAHRMFLECCYQALEHGGYAAGGAGRIGVFAGAGMHLYGHQFPASPLSRLGLEPDTAPAKLQALIGTQPDFLATRVAYRLGLTGPAVSVQTACSTSLVAVHLATQSILTGDCDLALAGAAAVHLPQRSGYRHYPGFILSPTGCCRAFDAAADGTVGGSGVATVLLKPLEAALADGDTVHAVILGSAVNNDGARKVGYAAPSVAGQVEVVRLALRRAGVRPGTISFLEAHGTGTELGDPVEVTALMKVLSEPGPSVPCTLGSVKPNIGHLDTCAGMAGLIKTVLMLRHGELAPTINLTRLNPRLRLEGTRFDVGTVLRRWVSPGVPRRAGVTALGVGGTNAHIVLEEPPPGRSAGTARCLPLPVSARTPAALSLLAGNLRDYLRAHPELAVADVVTTMALGRPHLPCRLAVTGQTGDELARALDRKLADVPAPPVPASDTVAFAFSGQGDSRPGMARELYAACRVVRTVLDECEQHFRRHFGGSLLEPLVTETRGWPAGTAQPAQFAFQVALARLWQELIGPPALVTGHSLGEYAALCVAGALPLREGIWLTGHRDVLMSEGTTAGGMLAIAASADTARRIAADSGTEVAVVNGTQARVLSGASTAVDDAIGRLEDAGIAWQQLTVRTAYHSALLDPVLDAFSTRAREVSLAPLSVPMVSGVDGQRLETGTTIGAGYLRGHARRPVRFDLALRTLGGLGCRDFVEIGHGTTLAGHGGRALPDSRWTGGVRSERDLWAAVGDRYARGDTINWTAVVAGGRRIPLPGHPMRRETLRPPRLETQLPPDGPRDADGSGKAPESFRGVAERQLLEAARMVDDLGLLMTRQLSAYGGDADHGSPRGD